MLHFFEIITACLRQCMFICMYSLIHYSFYGKIKVIYMFICMYSLIHYSFYGKIKAIYQPTNKQRRNNVILTYVKMTFLRRCMFTVSYRAPTALNNTCNMLTIYILGENQQTTFETVFSFSQKTSFDISCKYSSIESIYLKCQTLFSGNNKKNITKMSSLEFALGV